MDHALSCDASKRPRKNHHVEGPIWIRQMLCRADGEARVSNTGLTRVLLRGSNSLDIRIEPVDAHGDRRHTERETAIATPEVQDALPAHEPLAAPLAELVDGARSKRRGERGDVLPEVSDQARRTSAHVRAQLTSAFRNDVAREESPDRDGRRDGTVLNSTATLAASAIE